MRGLILGGVTLVVLGLVVEFVALGWVCTTNPVYSFPSAPSCSETLTIAGGGAALFFLGVVLTVTSWRSRNRRPPGRQPRTDLD
jgi:hypothetical protein